MKNKWLVDLCVLLVFGFVVTACDMGNSGSKDLSGSRDLYSSIQVNNQLSHPSRSMARSIAAGDTVELYIHHLEYMEDANYRALIIIANGDRDMGSKGGILNNAGWYSVNADLGITNDSNDGPYSSFLLGVSKLRVNGTEYNFPDPLGPDGVVFGRWSDIWAGSHGGINSPEYPDNFDGITIDGSTISLKTVLTVEPDILGTPDSTGYDSHGLADDPFMHIKVEGRINK
jgi:hypothetical protein